MSNRRCESCGGAMPGRMHRQRDEKGRLICPSCANSGIEGGWNMAYAARNLSEEQLAEFRQREAEAFTAIIRAATPAKKTSGIMDYYDVVVRARGDEAGTVEYGTADLLDAIKVAESTFRGPATRGGENSVLVINRGNGTVFWSNGQNTDTGRFTGAGLQTVAHDSGDGATIFHCPFCGSGTVVGGQDGTTTCDYCHNSFTVQVQPKFKNMPQTVNGQPFNVPGMPGGGPDAGASAETEQGAADDALTNPPPDKPVQGPSGSPNPFAAAALLTDDGVVLDGEHFARRLALAYADDPQAVLAQVRSENGRG